VATRAKGGTDAGDNPADDRIVVAKRALVDVDWNDDGPRPIGGEGTRQCRNGDCHDADRNSESLYRHDPAGRDGSLR